jgi:hypothetical protein
MPRVLSSSRLLAISGVLWLARRRASAAFSPWTKKTFGGFEGAFVHTDTQTHKSLYPQTPKRWLIAGSRLLFSKQKKGEPAEPAQ